MEQEKPIAGEWYWVRRAEPAPDTKNREWFPAQRDTNGWTLDPYWHELDSQSNIVEWRRIQRLENTDYGQTNQADEA